MGIHNFHPEGMSYSPGDGESRVVLLFESPGMTEAFFNAPLSGRTGLRYCQIVKKLFEKGVLSQQGEEPVVWTEFCKCNARVINAYPFYSRISNASKLNFALSEDCLCSIKRCIQKRRGCVMLCFGEIACRIFEELKKRDVSMPTTVIKLWHISSRNSHFTCDTNVGEEAPTKWLCQADNIAQYIKSCIGQKHVFGWRKIREVIGTSRWDGDEKGPDWLKDGEDWMKSTGNKGVLR